MNSTNKKGNPTKIPFWHMEQKGLFGMLKELKENRSTKDLWHSSFVPLKNIIFIMLLGISVFGNLLDLSIIGVYVNSYVLYVNIGYLVLAFIVFISHSLKKINTETANHIIIYAILINILLSLNINHPRFTDFFLRETIFIGILIFLSGFIYRKNVIYISIIYNCYFIIAILFRKNDFLYDNAGTLMLACIGFQFILFYTFTILEYVNFQQYNLNLKLHQTNIILDKQKQALAKSEAQFRLMTEKAGDFIALINNAGFIEYASPSIKAAIGLSHKEMQHKNVFELIHTRDNQYMRDYVKDVFANKPSTVVQYRIKHTLGHYIWLETNMELLPHGEQIVCVNRDVTKRKEMEQALIRVNHTKDRFFSIIAHDLKSPMAQLYSSAEFLHKRADKVSSEDRKFLIDSIFEGSLKMSNLLDDLLLWSRTQMDSVKIEPASIDTSKLLNETLELFEGQIKKKSLSINLPENEISKVFADENSLKTIFRNLVSNAIKFSYPNGDIVILAHKKDQKVELSLSDFGVGIKKEKLESIFSIEDSYSTPGTEDEIGTGLGLIICKELAIKNQSNLSIESQEGKGTTIKLELPVPKD